MSDIFLIGKVKFYDDLVNYFGRIIDDVNGKEYNFKKYVKPSSAPIWSACSTPAAGDIVKYKLEASNRKGQYRAIEVSKINGIKNEEYDAIISALKELSSTEISASDFFVKNAQIVNDNTSFIELCSLLKYYCAVDYSNYGEYVCHVFNNLNTEYKYRFLISRDIVKCSLPVETLFPLIDAGYNYDIVRKGVSTEQDEKRLLEYALNKLDTILLLNIFSRWVYKLPQNDPTYCSVIQRVNSSVSSENLFELIKENQQLSTYDNSLFILHFFDKSFFLNRENTLDDLRYILPLKFDYEEKIILVDAIKTTIKDKLTRLKIGALYSTSAFFTQEECEQYKIHAISNLNADELIDLWLSGFINLPFSIEDLNDYICNSSNPTDKIDSIISSDKLEENSLNDLVARYCSQLKLSQETISWCLNNKRYAKLPFSVDDLLSFILKLPDSTSLLDSVVDSQILDKDQTSLLLSRYGSSIMLQKENVEWCIEHKQDIENNKSVCEDLQVVENIITWVHSDNLDSFDEVYLSYFHYLSDVHQMMFLRKYVELKRLNLTQITVGKLERLIYHKKDIDINVYIVIYSLCKLRREQKFISNYELYEAIAEIHPISGSIGKSLRELETSQLFDRCATRYSIRERSESHHSDALSCVIRVDKDNNSEIKILKDFREVSDIIKRCIPHEHRKYDPISKMWSCDKIVYDSVWTFAKSVTSIVMCGGKSYEPFLNIYASSPQFCEGIEYSDKRINRKAYWCIGNSCLRCNIKRHESYTSYTLYDFIYILNLDKLCNDIDKMLRYFYSNINWFSNSISHLYCRECERILTPCMPSSNNHNYAAHTIINYQCANKSCDEYKKAIYLNHCFMPRCNSIVDSRDSQKCPNGFVICENCGVCCGSSQFERKLKAGLSIPNIRFHFDNEEFYCAKCGALLCKIDDNSFECQNCSSYKLTLKRLKNNEIVTKTEFCKNSADDIF